MPDDVPLDAHEHLEHAHHAAHERDPFTSRVSITVAILAVLAAGVSSLETYESAGAIIGANHAVLAQDQATDQWNLYEAKSLKKNLYVLATDAGGPHAADYAKKAKAEGADQGVAQAEAKRLEKVREAALADSDRHEARHHRLAVSATLLEIGIAISTIAIITKKRWPWVGAAILGLVGATLAGLAYAL